MRFDRLGALFAFALAGCASSIASTNSPDALSANTQATANPALWPTAATPPAITDAKTEREISPLLSRMAVEQKVGQLIQADISSIKPEDLARYPLGSILAGGNSGPYGDERASAAQWKKLVDAFRDVSRTSGAGIPILFGVDAVHGHSNLPEATIFPHNIGLGAARDTDLIERIGVATAAEISGSGIEWTFAPTLAVPQDLRWGRTYEGYSSDPALIARYARAMTTGLQGTLVAGKPLAAERVALNFLQHLSGIATLTRKYVEAVAGTNAKIVDTRKTAPGLRALQKYAVSIGGGGENPCLPQRGRVVARWPPSAAAIIACVTPSVGAATLAFSSSPVMLQPASARAAAAIVMKRIGSPLARVPSSSVANLT